MTRYLIPSVSLGVRVLGSFHTNPGFAKNESFDFSSSAASSTFAHAWRLTPDEAGRHFDPTDDGQPLSLRPDGSPSTLESKEYIFFGKLDVKARLAMSQDLMASMELESGSDDRFGWMIPGVRLGEPQKAHCFYTSTFFRSTYSNTFELTPPDPQRSHMFSVEWTDTELAFAVDRDRISLNFGDIPREAWPQTPARIRLAVSASDQPDMPSPLSERRSESPDSSVMHIESVRVDDYVGWCQDKHDRVEYEYDDRALGWQDVKVKGCRKRRSPGMLTPDASDPTPVKAASTSTTTEDGDSYRRATRTSFDSDSSYTALTTGQPAEPPGAATFNSPPIFWLFLFSIVALHFLALSR